MDVAEFARHAVGEPPSDSRTAGTWLWRWPPRDQARSGTRSAMESDRSQLVAWRSRSLAKGQLSNHGRAHVRQVPESEIAREGAGLWALAQPVAVAIEEQAQIRALR